jgi:hypothetical protein
MIQPNLSARFISGIEEVGKVFLGSIWLFSIRSSTGFVVLGILKPEAVDSGASFPRGRDACR